ncbi:hypothetical protein RB195_007042 [Necator americanus]|uniref:Transforming acidic coiled-coil-containing protein C-terminal domain-containing protein n=1 Tax=Necator americanus TaxID=51031 RepID=A0ABR1BVD7_NECAM
MSRCLLEEQAPHGFEMSQLMFSDDDDVSRHAADLEQIHKSIALNEPSFLPFNSAYCKENQISCTRLEKTPIYRRLHPERRCPLGEVFVKPFVPVTNSNDEYEFGSDHDACNEQAVRSSFSYSRPPSTESSASSGSATDQRPNTPLSTSNTPRLDRRKRLRLQKLRDAVIAARSTASDDDQEFVPGPCEFGSLLDDQETPTRKLRPRRELWNSDDDLPLADVQLQVVLDISEKEAQAFAALKRSSECVSPAEANTTDHDVDDFAYLPTSQPIQSNLKRGAKRKRTQLSTPKAGDSDTFSPRSVKVTRTATSRRKRRHTTGECHTLTEGQSDSDMDQPLSHFATFSDVHKMSRSTAKKKKSRLSCGNSTDEEYKGSDSEMPLSEIRRRQRIVNDITGDLCGYLRGVDKYFNEVLLDLLICDQPTSHLLWTSWKIVDDKSGMKPPRSTASTESGMEIVQKSLEGLSLEDKVTKLLKRVVESEDQNAKLREKAAQVDKVTKANASLEKKLEKTNLILLKTEDAKGKLEELCRELQRMNKQIREDSLNKVRLLEHERQQAVEQLRTALKSIEASMNEGKERSDALAADNGRLAEKLKELGQEYESRITAIQEQYKEKDSYWQEYNKAKDIEIKLLKTKLEAAEINAQKSALEKEELTRTFVEGTARMGGALENEKALRAEVKRYAGRYEEITKSLAESNAAFDKFKKEIDRVNANFKKVETDSFKWKQKYEEASKNVLVLTMAKKELEENAVLQQKKLGQLEQLCRALSSRQTNPTATPTTDSAATATAALTSPTDQASSSSS